MYSDPIADMLTRIRNAMMIDQKATQVPLSKLKVEIARVLKQEGYIEDYEVGSETPAPMIHVKLKYYGDRRHSRPVITGLERVSRPGRRVYVKRDELPWVLSGMGIAIVSTSQGVMTADEARVKGVGGEILCKVW